MQHVPCKVRWQRDSAQASGEAASIVASAVRREDGKTVALVITVDGLTSEAVASRSRRLAACIGMTRPAHGERA